MIDIEAEVFKITPKPGDIVYIKINQRLDNEAHRLLRDARKRLQERYENVFIIICINLDVDVVLKDG